MRTIPSNRSRKKYADSQEVSAVDKVVRCRSKHHRSAVIETITSSNSRLLVGGNDENFKKRDFLGRFPYRTGEFLFKIHGSEAVHSRVVVAEKRTKKWLLAFLRYGDSGWDGGQITLVW